MKENRDFGGTSEVKVAQSCLTLRDLMDCSLVAYQVPPSMGFSWQECWSGLPFPSPGDLPDPGIEPGSPALEADALPWEPRAGQKALRFFCKILWRNSNELFGQLNEI